MKIPQRSANMKMQIWQIFLSEGTIAALHGQVAPVYEGFVPDLMLTINYVADFVNEDKSRYEAKEPDQQIVETPDPQLMCEFEMSAAQIADAKKLAGDGPDNRLRQLICSKLQELDLDASSYEDEENSDG